MVFRGVVFGRERVHLIKMIAVVYALGLIRAASGKAVYLLGAADSGSFLLIPGFIVAGRISAWL